LENLPFADDETTKNPKCSLRTNVFKNTVILLIMLIKLFGFNSLWESCPYDFQISKKWIKTLCTIIIHSTNVIKVVTVI